MLKEGKEQLKCNHKWEQVSGVHSKVKGFGFFVTFICRKCKKHKIEEYKDIDEI